MVIMAIMVIMVIIIIVIMTCTAALCGAFYHARERHALASTLLLRWQLHLLASLLQPCLYDDGDGGGVR